MKRSLKYISLSLVAVLLLAAHVAVASFTGNTTGKKNKYSLRTLNKKTVKAYSLSSLKTSTFSFRGMQDFKLKTTEGSSIANHSAMRYGNGNTTFVFPYKLTVKGPGKFTTPKASLH